MCESLHTCVTYYEGNKCPFVPSQTNGLEDGRSLDTDTVRLIALSRALGLFCLAAWEKSCMRFMSRLHVGLMRHKR